MPPSTKPAGALFLAAAPPVARRQRRDPDREPARPVTRPFLEPVAPVAPAAPTLVLSDACGGGNHSQCPKTIMLIPPVAGKRFTRCECTTCAHPGRGRPRKAR